MVFAEDFKVPKGWQGRYEAIESPGCAYLGAANAGIHMAFSPGGPIWRDVSGFTPGQSYTISFEVRTLDPSDAGKAMFLVDDKVLHSIRGNGKVSVKFTASQATHRIKFDWKVQNIKMAPVHVTRLKVVAESGAKDLAGDKQQYLGTWQWNYLDSGRNLSATVHVTRDATGELSARIKRDARFNDTSLREFQVGNGNMRGKVINNVSDCLSCPSYAREWVYAFDIKSMSVKEVVRVKGIDRSEKNYPLTRQGQ